jgi:TMEM175 potassium channel family protein
VEWLTKQRLEALSDGVFAIALTLLVLDIRLGGSSAQPLWQRISESAPNVVVYALSFIIIGTYWVAHHSMIGPLGPVNRTLTWLNLVVLMTVSFLPFPTSILAENPLDPAAIQFYCVCVSLVNLISTLLWLYGTRLSNIRERLRKTVAVVHVSPILIYGLAAALCPLSRMIGWVLIVSVPLFFIVPNPIVNRLLKEVAEVSEANLMV